MKKADEAFDFARDAKDEFENGDLEKKRHILSRLGSNLILENKILRVDLDDVLTAIREAAKEVKTIHEQLEPAKNVEDKVKLEQLYAKSPVLLRD